MYQEQWKLIDEAYQGSGGFNTGSYISKYPRESDEKYQQRQKIAYYPNIIASKIKRYIGYLFKKLPTRTTDNKILNQIIQDIDLNNNTLDTFMQNFTLEAKLRGCNIILVDNVSQITSQNQKQQQELREYPYLVKILPERVLNYKLNKYGKFDFVIFSDTVDNSTVAEKKIDIIKRYYDTTSWAIFDADDKIVEQGEHNLGVCPLVFFSESGIFPSLGEFTQLGGIAKRYYNLKSELDELLRGQTFSILAIQKKIGKSSEIVTSTDNGILYDGDKAPQFITPPSTPTTAYENEIKQLENLLDKITYDLNTSGGVESGLALDIKFQGLNSSLGSYASKLQNFEYQIFDIIQRYLNTNIDIDITYPHEFNITDIQKELETLGLMKEYDIKPYEKIKLLQIIKSDLPNIDDEVLNSINTILEDRYKEV